ncbi:MAG: TRAP transporter substrate-binding protein [Eubacteriales bacterium]|nr:TRAP transporter substrate-binding protein [Eubacteriales bacterium]
MLKKSKVSVFLVLVLVLSLVAVGCGGEKADASGESVEWLANSVWPPANQQSIGLEEFAVKVKEATDGKVTIRVQTGGALGYTGPELLRAVRDNLVPVSDMLTSGVAGDEPLFGIVTIPFLIQNFEEGKMLNDIARPYFDEVAETKWNQKILYIAPWPAAGVWSKDEVTSVEDMNGLKTRTYDENGALFMEAVGATPYPLPFSEVYSSLATGVIDSVLTSTPTAVDGKFWEVLDYYAPVSITMATDLVTVNLTEFNKLDEETQNQILAVAKEVEDMMWEAVAAQDKEMEKISNDNGITTVAPSQEFLDDLSEITQHIREDWLRNAPAEAREIVEAFNQQVGR